MRLSSATEIVVLNDYAGITGGSSSVALQSALTLAARKIHVTLFTAVGPVAATLQNNAYLNVVCTDQHSIADDPSRFRSSFRGIWNLKAIRELTNLLRSKDPAKTIVHVHTWMKALSPGVISTALDRGFRVVLTLHDFFTVCPSGGFYIHPERKTCDKRPLSASCLKCNCDRRAYTHKLWRFARTAMQNWWLRVADRVHHYIGVSQFSVDLMKPYLPPGVPVTIVRNPVNCRDFGPAPVDTGSEFVFLGRLVPEKGAELFAEAADRAGVAGIFVGEGEMEDDLKRRFPRATFRGWMEPAQVTAAIRQARALVFPSLWYETLGLSAVEAMANGVPVVVSDHCAASEFVQDGYSGLHFQSGSVESLAAQLRRLRNGDLALRLGRKAYNWYWKEPWSLDSHVDQLLNIYEDMLHHQHTRKNEIIS
ncbi:MAG TPA: glycosyltransferase family 4 protein [Terrimicrobiaceae bacterium]